MSNQNLAPVVSSNIAAIGHFDDKLVVEFSDGDLYAYLDVQPYLFENMMQAISKGSFLNAEIKPYFKFKQITATELETMAMEQKGNTARPKKTKKQKMVVFSDMVKHNLNFAFFF